MLSVLYAAGAHTDDGTGWQLPFTATLVAVVLVTVATVVGAWLARRGFGRPALLLAAASGILLIIAVLDLLPDAWNEAHEAGVPHWTVLLTALASYGVMGAVVRMGCPCEPGRAGGIGVASGLCSAPLPGGGDPGADRLGRRGGGAPGARGRRGPGAGRSAGRNRDGAWLHEIGLACLSPVAGAFVTSALPIPDGLMPLLLAFVGGVLAQAAWVALRLAHQQRPADRRVLGVPAAMAMPLAAVLTALVVLVGAVNR
ncbi:hypothetical protein SHIRM173S_04069 [Streptomyces hirsutus]